MSTNTPGKGALLRSFPSRLLDRNASILAFNDRVLFNASLQSVPLLERLRYLAIVSSNLDEFFEVRFATVLAEGFGDFDRSQPLASDSPLRQLIHAAQTLVRRQYELYNDELLPAISREGVRIVPHGERDNAQRRWVRRYFLEQVRPLLVPVALDPAHPFPQVANKSLNFIVRLAGVDAMGRVQDVAIVRVPRVLPRYLVMPARVCGDGLGIVSISSLIRAHLADLFPGREIAEFSQFRVTRHSDVSFDDAEISDLRGALKLGLQHRHFGSAVRLEVSSGCSDTLADFLIRHFDLPAELLFRVPGPVNLVRLQQLIELTSRQDLCFPAYAPKMPAVWRHGRSIFEQIKDNDIFVHQPYESFDAVLEFLREAVHDPAVLAIRQTVYRTGPQSELMELLQVALRLGKEVTAVVEITARFDEQFNIDWAERLEALGAQVVHGIVGLKTHAKMLLVVRREGNRLRRYAHLSTGNYNPRTARLYTDWSQLTDCPRLTSDVEQVFLHLSSQSRLPRLRELWVAPFRLQSKLLQTVNRCSRAARAGEVARIDLKMNALTDEVLIRALDVAADAGVDVNLIIRGPCLLPAGRRASGARVRVRSVVGRMLEHARVFHFQAGSVDELYLSSADWMSRNMLRRVELAWPVRDPAVKARIVHECLRLPWRDESSAWEMRASGRYQAPRHPFDASVASVQSALMKAYDTSSEAT